MIEIKAGENKFYVGEDAADTEAEVHYVPTGPKLIIIDHTHVGDHLRGQGVGALLVKKAVDYARENELKIVPLCPFAKREFSVHEEYHDVLAS